jgi:hypothetical protein
MSEYEPSLPMLEIDFQFTDHTCDSLEHSKRYVNNDLIKSIGLQAPIARIDLRNLSYDSYINKIKKYKTHYDSRKADKQGYICKPFAKRLFVPDMFTINHSATIRGGSHIKGYFTSSLDELGGPPERYIHFSLPSCPIHYLYYWGIFSPEPGYKQGDVITNERLIGYAFFRRIGNLAAYSQLVGHSDYLKYGIIYRLHFAIMEWICRRDDAYTQGIEYFMHGRYYDGGDGRILWRKKSHFEPAYILPPDGINKT